MKEKPLLCAGFSKLRVGTAPAEGSARVVAHPSHAHLLPPRMLMTRLPFSTVQPRSSCADVTESMVFSLPKSHTLGQGPAQGVQCRLQKAQQG